MANGPYHNNYRWPYMARLTRKDGSSIYWVQFHADPWIAEASFRSEVATERDDLTFKACRALPPMAWKAYGNLPDGRVWKMAGIAAKRALTMFMATM